MRIPPEVLLTIDQARPGDLTNQQEPGRILPKLGLLLPSRVCSLLAPFQA